MKNYSEQLRTDIVSSSGVSTTKHGTVDGYSDIKIEKGKIIDTSSSADAFTGQSAGDVIKMEGWSYDENNRIFKIVEVESGGEYIKVDKAVVDESSPESAGATIYTANEDLTVTGITVNDVVVDMVNHTTTASAPEGVSGKEYARVTAANTVTSFYPADSGDSLSIMWADLSEG